ncbi:SH3 domain-containing protein [Leptospira yasudae]|uniref:SH3 domain-containing protein n=1 Tax=Leptospira yasudae TaxID=2202201 RepID=UPI001C4E4C77|nr:SH3 domain-containing protein [Leptospira yasudae]MBW0433640.1 SH3 domain-containing protein [Leptospira yasudae]
MKKISMQSLTKLFAITSLLWIAVLAESNHAQDKKSQRYVLTSEGKLNIREKPKDGKVLFQLEKGEVVFVKEDSQYEEWQEISTKSGAKGYASSEFLSKKSPEELSDAKLFGSVYTSTEGSWFRSLAIRIKNQWVSASDFSAEAYYLEKKAIQEKEKGNAYERASIAGEFSPEKKEITGCQEIRVVRGNLAAFKKLNTYQNSVYAMFGSKIGDKVRSDRYEPSEKIGALLDSSAATIFKKKYPKAAELKFVKRGDFYSIKAPEKEYIYIRYALRVEPEEKAYYAAIYELNNGEVGKRIFEKFDVLSKDQAVYGGQYHLNDALDLDENGTPILILHHNGYDGYINEFARIKNNQLQTMFLSGGDAC